MSIGANISVITAGAILAFAVRLHTDGISVHAVGGVLMVVGLVGLAMQIRGLARQRELTTVQADASASPQAVLVRPNGSAQPSYGLTGTTADPLTPEQAAYRSRGEYTGNEW